MFFLRFLVGLKLFVSFCSFLYVKMCVLLDSIFFKFVKDNVFFEEFVVFLEIFDFFDNLD